jgi:hypothetical protein
VTDAERKLRFEFLTEALTLQADAVHTASAVRGVRDQVAALEQQLKREAGPPASVIAVVAKVLKALAGLQARVGGGGEEGGGGGGGGLRARVGGLYSDLDGSGVHQGTLFGPTGAQRQRLDAARKEIRTLQADLDRLLDTDVAALNEEIARLKVPRIVRPRPGSIEKQ